MIFILVFLYVSLMYLKYIIHELGDKEISALKVLPIGLLIGNFSIFLVHWLSPHNYLSYLEEIQSLVYYNYSNGVATIEHTWRMDPLMFEFLRNYVFTGFTEEISKLSAGFLVYMIYRRTTYYNLFLYIVLAAVFFAFIENIQYLGNYGPQVVITRCLFSTTTHICLGIILGYFMIKGIQQNSMIKSWTTVICGLLLASFLHGSFNFMAYMEEPIFNILVWLITVGLGIFLLQKVKKLV